MTFFQFFILFENFETVSKLFLDPQHKDKEWYDLQQEFEASGGKHLGQGSYGQVLTHPKWPYVVKMFTRDDPYLRFARYAYKNPHTSFPKFYGAPRKIVPEFSRNRSMGEIYLSRIEKLNPINKHTFHLLNEFKTTYDKYRYMTDRSRHAHSFYGDDYRGIIKELEATLKGMPKNIASALDAMHIINTESHNNNWGIEDWKEGNIMQRDNGDIVLIDPLWEGFNSWAAAREQENMNHDFGDALDMITQATRGGTGKDINPKLIRGGELPKQAKRKAPKKSILNVPDSLSDW